MALEWLNTGSPALTQQNAATQSTLPAWYNSYIQGIASKATDIASNPFQAYPGQQLADFNDDQRAAFDTVRSNQGAYKPYLGAGGESLTGAVSAVSGPAANWTDPGVADKYMSPYTKNVVDEIARVGNRNLTENIIPQVQSNFVGAGQFGSTRNAEILGRSVRDAQTDISGLQSTALQSGYNAGAGIFGADANRTQQQGALQANTSIAAGAGLGSLATQAQALGNTDANALNTIGTQQQALEQTGYDKSKAIFDQQQNWDWTQLGKVQGAVQGAQLPTGTTTAQAGTQSSAGSSPLSWLTAISGLYNAYNGAGGTATTQPSVKQP